MKGGEAAKRGSITSASKHQARLPFLLKIENRTVTGTKTEALAWAKAAGVRNG